MQQQERFEILPFDRFRESLDRIKGKVLRREQIILLPKDKVFGEEDVNSVAQVFGLNVNDPVEADVAKLAITLRDLAIDTFLMTKEELIRQNFLCNIAQDFVKATESRFQVVESRLNDPGEAFEGRFNGFEEKLKRFEDRLESIDQRLTGLDKRLTGLNERFDDLEGRIDELDEKWDKEFHEIKALLKRRRTEEEASEASGSPKLKASRGSGGGGGVLENLSRHPGRSC